MEAKAQQASDSPGEAFLFPGRKWLLRLDSNLAAEGATSERQPGEAFLLPQEEWLLRLDSNQQPSG